MLRTHRKNVRQFSRSGGSSLSAPSDNSNCISVFGRRKHSLNPATNVPQPSLLRLKRQRLTKEQLLDIQRTDTDLDSAIMNKLMTPDELATLSELQREINGTSGLHDPTTNEIPSHAAESNLEDAIVEDDGDEVWEDVIENMGSIGRSEWSTRVTNESQAWNADISALCDAYLAYRANESQPVTSSPASDRVSAFSITCIDLTGESTKTFTGPSDTSINSTLLRNGYLGATPEHPKLAISVLVLRILAAVHRRGPSVSIQVMSKAFCDLRNVPYQPYFRAQLTSALDTFQMLQREVKRRLRIAMGGNLQIHTACAACMYKLKNEPQLRYAMLVTCDGNDSLKRCAAAAKADLRHYESDYFIPRVQVDRFQHEVPARARKRGNNLDDDDELSECEKRWKNAKVDNDPEKQTKTIFHETGIFICSCRHGFVLFACDMIRSGEQAKYGLAIIERLIDTYGDNLMMGYDIGCTFKGTAGRSPLLGPRIRESQFDMCIGSFHGPAHNRRCQTRYHPHNIPGTGLTDFENCETIFSSSNRLAGSTRLSSAFHRHQRIDNHFDGMNDDAHQNLGLLLRSKYKMALKERDEAEATIAQFSSISSNVLDTYFSMECEYLDSMTAPPPDDLLAIEYLNLLERLESKEKDYKTCHGDSFLTIEGPSTNDLRRSTQTIQRIESRRRTTLDQLLMIQDEVERFEDRHKISIRWTRFSREWINADKKRKDQHYRHCVDELERLVVQRFFELSRAGLTGTGYKLRQHIAKALVARSKAVKTAISHYNQAASELTPPARTITWEEITNLKILSDLELLRDSRERILDQDWAKPHNRRLVEVWHRFQRAEEELERLDVEVRRVRTMIHDERQELPPLASRIAETNHGLGWAAILYVTRRLKVNEIIDKQLKELVFQRQFTGAQDIGVHVNKHGRELREDYIDESHLQVDITPHGDASDLEVGEPNETQETAGEVDEEVLSEQLSQWHLALARDDSNVI